MKIITYPNIILNRLSMPVDVFDRELREFIEEMKDTCFRAEGAGLSAVQVGRHERILIYALDTNQDRFAVMVNPIITFADYGRQDTKEEGCLSLPGETVNVRRPKSIIVSFQDGRGVRKVKKLKDLKARIVLHEIDHLNGRLITDYE